jgi:manganese oxidase
MGMLPFPRTVLRHGALPVIIVLLATAFGGVTGNAAPSAAASGVCKTMNLYAEELPPGPGGDARLGFGHSPTRATIPGPLIELTEGDCLKIRLTNDVSAATLQKLKTKFGGDPSLPLAVSLHPHGLKYHRDSDGTVSSNSFVPPGTSRVFTWIANPGTAGYWWYHDHMVGTEHGTGGMASGLWGGLIVRRAGDPKPDVRTFVLAMGDNYTFNLQTWPNTPTFVAAQGQRIEFLVFAWGNETHVFHLHAHSWADNRTGIPQPGIDTATVDTKVLGPSTSFGFQVIAGDISGPNNWMYHCHVQFHSDLGMMGFLQVRPAA